MVKQFWITSDGSKFEEEDDAKLYEYNQTHTEIRVAARNKFMILYDKLRKEGGRGKHYITIEVEL